MSASRILKVTLLVSLTALLGFAALYLTAPIGQAARDERELRNVFLLAVGILGLVGILYPGRQWAAKTGGRAILAAAVLLPVYAALQLVPLPLAALRAVSPARAELLDALAPLQLRPGFAPLSVAPSVTLNHFLLFTGYACVFLLVREAARSSGGTPWLFALPIVGIASAEAAWGISQFFSGDANAFAHGSYPIRNHFAGFLEMSLPFAIAYGASGIRLAGRRGAFPAGATIRITVGFAAAGLMFAGIFYSLSRMGLVATVGSAIALGLLATAARVQGQKKWWIAVAICVAVVLAAAAAAPMELILRFADDSSEGRTAMWRDTLHLIAVYPVFGCGLGGYESAGARFQSSGFEFVQDYAHNDYLQYLAELGVVGFSIAACFVLLVLRRAIQAGVRGPEENSRWLGLACGAALVAILIHSAADFNLYVPANAVLLAWICGLAAAIPEPPGSA